MERYLFLFLLCAVLVALVDRCSGADLLSVDSKPAGPKVHQLAECLTVKGAKLYSASYCGPCIQQELMFGDAVKKLVVFECDDEGAGEKACRKAYINEVPTWTFPGQEPIHGLQSLDALAERSGCPKP